MKYIILSKFDFQSKGQRIGSLIRMFDHYDEASTVYRREYDPKIWVLLEAQSAQEPAFPDYPNRR